MSLGLGSTAGYPRRPDGGVVIVSAFSVGSHGADYELAISIADTFVCAIP
jgi:hypothetical protein